MDHHEPDLGAVRFNTTVQSIRTMGSSPIICGESAWRYHATPPLLRSAALPPDTAPDFSALRTNAREADRLVHAHLPTDLKGIPLPVVACSGPANDRHRSHTVAPCRCPGWLTADDTVLTASGLRILNPRAALADMSSRLNWVHLALRMMEALGLYAIHVETERSRMTLNCLLAEQVLTQDGQRARPDHIREFCDAHGKTVSFLDRRGCEVPWELGFDRFGNPTEHWKRAPLLTMDDLMEMSERLRGWRGSKTFRDALTCACPGSGSILESKLLLLMCAPTRLGGEGWPRPLLNARLDFTVEQRSLGVGHYCVCDQLWKRQQVVVEANGMAFHADKQGFILASGRAAALQHAGYTVIDVSYGQVSKLEAFDLMVHTLAKALGLPLRKRTAAFLARRQKLHQLLFHRHARTHTKPFSSTYVSQAQRRRDLVEGAFACVCTRAGSLRDLPFEAGPCRLPCKEAARPQRKPGHQAP